MTIFTSILPIQKLLNCCARATNDPDEQLREWAREQLKMQNVKLKIEDNE